MKLTDFDFDLPQELIAQLPLPERSASRLLQLDPITHQIKHHIFRELPELLQPNDLLIFNNTKVIPARMFGTKTTGGKVEILLERILSAKLICAQIRASKTPQLESSIYLLANGKKSDIALKVIAKDSGFYTLELLAPITIETMLTRFGQLPLPPYIQHQPTEADEKRYQTIYAEHSGAVAAPTAGLHFDPTIFQALAKKQIETAFVTLHVGAGTFQPVRVDDIREHQMHHEYFTLCEEVVTKIKNTKQRGGRIIAVGTTTVRTLESAAASCELKAMSGATNIFIYPGYKFRVIDALITNFHLPKSTLLMLVSALAGRDNILMAYQAAIKLQYRFFSYGDAMLII